MISKLRREQEITYPDSRIWDLFKNAWRYWVISHQELNEILSGFDNNEDFDDNNGCLEPPNSQLDRQCFEIFRKESHNNKVDQETIQRFYEFGYFIEDEQIQDLIDQTLLREEIERLQREAQLPDQVDRLSHEIEELHTQISNLEPINELEQVLDQRIAEVQQSFESRLSQITTSQNVNRLTQAIESLKSRISEINESLRNQIDEINHNLSNRIEILENSQRGIDSDINDFVDHIEKIIKQLEQKSQSIGKPIKERLSGIDSAISRIKSELEKHNKTTDMPEKPPETLRIIERETKAPRIAHRALKIGETFASKFQKNNKHYQDENDYLSDFQYSLRRFGITDSDETAAAIHVALKAFPVLEIADTRIFKIWDLMCDEHLLHTEIFVEMGWFGLQDWFPDLLADECFGERLERIDLEISIQKMLEMGNMLWAIHFRNCDRSFPECYLPSFINRIKEFSESTIKIFLTRCSGKNRCEITEDAYALMARLPEPQEREPVEARKLKTSGIIVTQSEWESWCRTEPNVDQRLENQFDIVDQLRSTIEENGGRISKTPLREILHYLRLSQSIEMSPTRALDWAMTMRLFPWIEKQPNIIENVLSRISQEYDDLEHFNEALQQALVNSNESN